MRIESSLVCEKASKLADGRTVAYGIYPRILRLPHGRRGGSMGVAILVQVSFGGFAPLPVTGRLNMPDGSVSDVFALPMPAGIDTRGTLEFLVDGVPVPFGQSGGTLRMELRSGLGVWRDAGVLVIEFEDAPAEVVAEGAGGMDAALRDVGGVAH